MAVLLTEGERHDCLPFVELSTQASESGTVERDAVDKAYERNPIRDTLAANFPHLFILPR